MITKFAKKYIKKYIDNIKAEFLNDVSSQIDRFIKSTTNSAAEQNSELLKNISLHINQFTISQSFNSQNATKLNKHSEDIPPIFDSLFSLWTHIASNLAHWKECDIILTCPLTHSGASSLFREQPLFLLSNFSEFNIFLEQYKEKKFTSIGIISPFIFLKLINQDILLSKLMQMCSKNLLIVFMNYENSKISKYLTVLHQVGFYHVLTLFNDNRDGILSRGTLPTGEYHCFYQSVNFPTPPNSWITSSAHRMNFPEVDQFPWGHILGKTALTTDNYIYVPPEEFAIAIKKHKGISNSIQTSIIQGTFLWNSVGPGHASLISCYDGPGDTNMYALLVQSNSPTAISISIYKNDGEWKCLEDKMREITKFHCEDREKLSINLWLKTTPESIIAGTGKEILFEINDTCLPRNHVMGVRFYSDTILLAEIQTKHFEDKQI